eukprot:5054276-Prymnesium_polylepis.1
MDNFCTNTPVLTLARSLWYKTDAALYSADIMQGLSRMLDHEMPWPAKRRLRQRQAVCWYDRMSLNQLKTPIENVAVMQAQLDALNLPRRLLL